MKRFKVIAILLVAALLLGFAACGEKEEPAPATTPAEGETAPEAPEATPAETPAPEGELVKVTVGVVGEDSLMWPPIIEALKAEGIEIELVKFGDYAIPNAAVNDKEVDLNAFQHYAYLNEEIANKGYKILSIGETYISPQNIYSSKLTNLEELTDGDLVAIPNDPTNGGRALKVLEQAGLIKLDPEKGYTPEVRDITENTLNLQFQEVDAAMVYSLLPDVAIGVINGNYALDARLNPEEDALFVEEFSSGDGSERNPYINVMVAHEDEKDNETFKKVLAAYQSETTEETFKTVYEGYYLPGWKQQ